MPRSSWTAIAALVALGASTLPGIRSRAQDRPVETVGTADPALLRRLERLEKELAEVRSEKDREIRGLRSQIDQLQGELPDVRTQPLPSLVPLPMPGGDSGDSNSDGGGGGSAGGGGSGGGQQGGGGSGDGYAGGAGSGSLSTSGGGGGGGGGQGSVGRGERTGSRSPAGYKLQAQYKYNFAGGYFSLFDEDKEFVVNFQNMLVADGTFYGRQNPLSNQVGFNIPFQRTYLYGNITKNWEFQISEQSSEGTFNLLDLMVNVHYDDRLMFKFGRYLAPFYYQDYATFPMLVPTIAYSPLFQFAAQRQVGAMFWGKVWENRFQYQAGIFNGVPNGYFDFDRNKDFIASATLTPFKAGEVEWLQDLGFGFSMQTGWQNYMLNRASDLTLISGSGSPFLGHQYITSSGVTFFQYHDDVRAWGNQTRLAPHFFWYGRFSVLAEYVVQSRELADYRVHDMSVQRGFYVQASYFLTGERNTGDGTGGFPTIIPKRPLSPSNNEYGPGAWELAAQFTELDVGRRDIQLGLADARWATRLDEVQLGVNWWPNKYVRVSFDWVYDRFNQPIAWPISNNQTNYSGNRRSNPVQEFDVFWTRIAFFF